jgi:hypothetical protein
VLGDSRLTIGDAPDGTYDMLIIDAVSSDSIPMHLLTRKAPALYLRKLAPGGRLLFHDSSRTRDLRSVIGALGRAAFDAELDLVLKSYDTETPASLRYRLRRRR